jgi:hypothetical protein
MIQYSRSVRDSATKKPTPYRQLLKPKTQSHIKGILNNEYFCIRYE